MKQFNGCQTTSGLVIQFMLVYAFVGSFTSSSIWRLSIPLATIGITLIYHKVINKELKHRKDT